MTKSLVCPGCNTVFIIEPEMAGKKYRCKKCSSVIVVDKNMFEKESIEIPVEIKNIGSNILPKNVESIRASSGFTSRQIIALFGSIILFIGVFMPIVSFPIVGSINYFKNGEGDGVIILILAAISIVLILKKNFKGLWITGLASIGIMLFTFFNLLNKLSEVKADMNSKLSGNPFRGFADMAVQSIQLQWGWALLIVGALMIIASAMMKNEPER